MLSGQVWRIADLGAKHSFLLAGLRWSGMPMHMVEADQARGTLVRLSMDDPAMNIHTMTLSAAYPVEYPRDRQDACLLSGFGPTYLRSGDNPARWEITTPSFPPQ